MSRLLRRIALVVGPPLLALVLAACLGALLVLVTPWLSRLGGHPLAPIDPLEVYRVMLRGTLGVQGISWVLYHATPLVFCGLAVALAFQGGLFNIGGQGQMMIGGLAATLVGIHLGRVTASPWLLLPACALAGAGGGAAWGAAPGALRAWRGAHEVITTIMLNFVAAGLAMYLLVHHFLDPANGQTQTREIAVGARVPSIHELFGVLDPQTPVNAMLPVAVVASLLCWTALRLTRWGYELRAVGANPHAAACGGISSARTTVGVMALSGALAGLASLALVHGHQRHFGMHVFAGEYGFWGIAVALLARNHPLGVLPAALLFGFLFQGSSEIGFETALPRDAITILQGLVIVCVVVVGELCVRWLAPLRKAPVD